MKRRRLALALLAAGLAGAAPASAETVLLAHGATLKVAGWSVEGPEITFELRGGGQVTLPLAALVGIVPDEVAEAIETGAAAGRPLEGLVREAAARHGLDPALLRAVVAVESAFEPRALSRKGAQGLMQLMPATAAELGVSDAFDPVQNLDGGSRHLRALLERFDGDLERALAAYNAGAGAVARHGGVPPYRETRDYVGRVLGRYRAAVE